MGGRRRAHGRDRAEPEEYEQRVVAFFDRTLEPDRTRRFMTSAFRQVEAGGLAGEDNALGFADRGLGLAAASPRLQPH